MIPVITVGFPFHPDHCRGFSLPNKFTVKLPTFSISRPSSRCMVTEQVQRQIAAAFRYHLDHCRGISLQNNFTVELPMFSIPIPTIAEMFRYRTTLQSDCRRFSFSSRPAPRRLVTEQGYHQITGVSTPSLHLRRISTFVVISPSCHREYSRITASTFVSRSPLNYRLYC